MTKPIPARTRLLALAPVTVGLTILLAACGGPSTTGTATPATLHNVSGSTPTTSPTSASLDPAEDCNDPNATIDASGNCLFPTTTTETPTYNLPPGYPQVVAVSGLPFQVKSWYQMSSYTQAVALAPGVWTPLTPGASVADAVNSGVADGFCASVKAYENDYLGGQSVGGSCW